MRKLKKYLKNHNMRHQDLADKLRCSRTTVTNIISRSLAPSKFLALKIEKVTDGEVKATDIRKDAVL